MKNLTIYPDGTFTRPPVRSHDPTPEGRAADYRRLAAARMDDMEVDQAGIYFAWAEWEERNLNP
jgi:hypothetical protein